LTAIGGLCFSFDCLQTASPGLLRDGLCLLFFGSLIFLAQKVWPIAIHKLGGNRQPETTIAVAEARIAAAAIGNPAVPGVAVPAAAAQHTAGAR